MMRKWFTVLIFIAVISCRHDSTVDKKEIITVSIAPFKYFVEKIAGEDFTVNTMVPPGANPHIYEPYPEQISKLQRSKAYISNGYLGFEKAWLDRFYEINKTMVKLSLGDKMDPITSEDHHEGENAEGADPHYWVSPKCALIMASSIKELICSLNPAGKVKYESNYKTLISDIDSADNLAASLFADNTGSSFMIYHPNLAYLARDYNLVEVAVEFEGKEPPPSRLRELIDLARSEHINTIFVQKEYDSRNANSIAKEIGSTVTVIDPLSEDWLTTTLYIITELHKSLTEK
jgi:zinc transport system substrate-binding protein